MMTDKRENSKNGYQQYGLISVYEPLKCCDKTGIYTAALTVNGLGITSLTAAILRFNFIFSVLHHRRLHVLLQGNTLNVTRKESQTF